MNVKDTFDMLKLFIRFIVDSVFNFRVDRLIGS